MSVILSEEKNNLIENIAKCQGFDDYEVKVTTGSMKGDGYLGIINTVNIHDARKSKVLHLIIKSALTEEKLREKTPVRKAYEREIYMYKTVFPELKDFSQEVGITDGFKSIAKYYGSLLTDLNECLILENLKEIDFKLWDRKIPMNEEHISLVFESYAKFHATGLAFKILKPEKFEEISKNLVNIFQKDDETEDDKKQIEESFKHVFGNGFRAVVNNKEATEGLTKFTQNCKEFFVEDVRKPIKCATILHGDCWCNNMMFKYNDINDPAKPTEVCFLDWQISHVGSPILDLSYFFYASASKELLYDLKKFLKTYHLQFSKIIKVAGLNPDEVLTFEELEDQWKYFSRYGLFMSLLVMKVILSEVEEAPDLSKLAKEGKDLLQSISATDSINMETVNKRIADIIIFMNDNDFF